MEGRRAERRGPHTVKFDYSAIPVGYYDRIFHERKGAQSKWHHLKFNFFRACVANHTAHLDIGCGPGTFIGSLPAGFRSTGVDIAREQIDYAERRYGHPGRRFLQIGTGPLPFADNSFDVVTIIELVEHLTDEQNYHLLVEAHRVLASRGKLYISTPNYGSAWSLLERLVNHFGGVSYENQHISRFRASRLRAALVRAGFRKIRCHPYQGIAFAAAALSWKLASLIDHLERPMTRYWGFLLFAEGTK
jgi:2-polyprenyl-3-methyl-5-hydroxy-6-metoxy-1,4-benzoquinol methylase